MSGGLKRVEANSDVWPYSAPQFFLLFLRCRLCLYLRAFRKTFGSLDKDVSPLDKITVALGWIQIPHQACSWKGRWMPRVIRLGAGTEGGLRFHRLRKPLALWVALIWAAPGADLEAAAVAGCKIGNAPRWLAVAVSKLSDSLQCLFLVVHTYFYIYIYISLNLDPK